MPSKALPKGAFLKRLPAGPIECSPSFAVIVLQQEKCKRRSSRCRCAAYIDESLLIQNSRKPGYREISTACFLGIVIRKFCPVVLNNQSNQKATMTRIRSKSAILQVDSQIREDLTLLVSWYLLYFWSLDNNINMFIPGLRKRG